MWRQHGPPDDAEAGMGRSSRADAQQHREDIVEAAAAILKRRGLDGATIPQMMAEVGMTHGGFYRHFSSKDELAAAAIDHAFAEQRAEFDGIAARHAGDHAGALEELAAIYLSEQHRLRQIDDCPVAALATDVGRSAPGSAMRDPFTRGLDQILEQIAALGSDTAGSDEDRRVAIGIFATLVGAISLARATDDRALAAEILDAAHTHLDQLR
ncbi:TetR/AcrR family transcriptional regulator [Gryllotalpicola protaetiae]|uniref:TetR/AcrR family transcriptional regulator n=1 Tax=Gryllotalpicola protaetiae TaxID=2419771 RepID=A0A387BSP1_9MICO|nr:TetR/AcrR family transcriptional regulator [Gryllotalpicola protaetiae]AYG04046.1 TetR/AcrR family transcriptional regulator [Gryllotalpicola protaetiae]